MLRGTDEGFQITGICHSQRKSRNVPLIVPDGERTGFTLAYESNGAELMSI
jgi:hypothetical protein